MILRYWRPIVAAVLVAYILSLHHQIDGLHRQLERKQNQIDMLNQSIIDDLTSADAYRAKSIQAESALRKHREKARRTDETVRAFTDIPVPGSVGGMLAEVCAAHPAACADGQ